MTLQRKITFYILRLFTITALLLVSKISVSQNVTFTKTQDLNFGDFYPTGTGGSVIVNTSGVRSKVNNVVLFSSANVSCAIFSITGNGKVRYATSITISNSTLYRAGGGGSMSLNTFTYSPTPNINIRNRTVTLYVGARLTVGSIIANPPGNYSGTFNVIVNYY